MKILYLPESYISAKRIVSEQCPFPTPQKGLKYLPHTETTPVKRRVVAKAPKATHQTYKKTTVHQSNKVC